MTCIVGVKQDNRVWLACDGEMTWGWERHEVSKLIHTGELLLAWTGLGAVTITLQHRLGAPLVPEGQAEHYLSVILPDAIRSALKDNELWDEGRGQVRKGGALIVGFREHLISYDSHLAAYPATRDFVAHGSGGAVALGSLATTDELDLSGPDRALMAVQAASVWAVGVGGDPVVEEVPQ